MRCLINLTGIKEGADIAIIHECDIGAIAKASPRIYTYQKTKPYSRLDEQAIGDDHDGIDPMSLDDLRGKGIDVDLEFDHQLQSPGMSPLLAIKSKDSKTLTSTR